jgi:toxin FitB
LIVLDSSGWIEFFADGPHAQEFATRLRQPSNVLTPTVAIYEVDKRIKRETYLRLAYPIAATFEKYFTNDAIPPLAWRQS